MMPLTRLSLIALASMAAFADRASAQSDQPEDIYVARSVRESRVTPTDFCSTGRTGFSSASEDQYSLRSIALGPGGRITNTSVETVGDLHACFSPRSGNNASFYGEGHLSGVSFKGIGNCLVVKLDFPEQGLTSFRCWLDLSGLPAEYVGGLLTTSTVNSAHKMIGTETIPEGYTQASIATVRLWKKR
jgi:hypothetical protein